MGHKSKRGARGSPESTDLDQTNAKRFQEESNVVATEDSEKAEEEIEDNEEPSLNEGILVEIQITMSDIQRKQNHFAEELVTLRKDFNLQKMELASAKSDLKKIKKENTRLQRRLEDVRKRAARREEEIEELYVLQDELEQYTRKNSLKIHGIPESAYDSTEDVVMKVAEALDVEIKPEDIDISQKLFSEGEKSVIVKFISHKIKSKPYKKRTGLKNIKVSDISQNATSARLRVEGKKIFINENLTFFRKSLVKKAIEKRRQGMIVSVWTLDGKVYVKTSPAGTPIRIYEFNDLDGL